MRRISLDITRHKNPYLAEFERLHEGFKTTDSYYDALDYDKLMRLMTINTRHRHGLVGKFGFSVPSEEALQAIVDLKRPVLEVMAGSGYWAHLLKNRGVDVVATDNFSWGGSESAWSQSMGKWHEVRDIEASEAAQQYPDRVLLMGWPPMDEAAVRCLEAYTGDTVIYVGEWYGCTADEAFHDKLYDEWTFEQKVGLPQWGGIHDAMWILTRK